MSIDDRVGSFLSSLSNKLSQWQAGVSAARDTARVAMEAMVVDTADKLPQKTDGVVPHSSVVNLLNGRAGIERKMVEAAYKLPKKTGDTEAHSHLLDSIRGKGWDMLIRSSDDRSTKKCGYKAVAFINRKERQIQIATAGTKLRNKWDVWDNFKLVASSVPVLKRFISCVPSKLRPARMFLENIVTAVGGEEAATNYTFSTCGHSLGAVMADINGVEIVTHGLNFDHSTTFENPGSKAVVERVLLDIGVKREVCPTTMLKLSNSCTEFNTWRGYLNSSGHRLANKVNLVVPLSYQQTPTCRPVATALTSYLDKQMVRFASWSGISDIIEQTKEHRLTSFSKLSVDNCYSTEGWDNTRAGLSCRKIAPSTNESAQLANEDQEWSSLSCPHNSTLDDAHPVGLANKLSHITTAMVCFPAYHMVDLATAYLAACIVDRIRNNVQRDCSSSELLNGQWHDLSNLSTIQVNS